MKKILIGAIGLLALASCSQNETLEVNNDGNEILFGVSTENATRVQSGELFSSTVKPTEFTVFASYNNANFFPNTGAVKVMQDATDNTKWVTDGKTYYWPNTGNINFFAVRNGGTLTWNPAAGGSLTSEFTVSNQGVTYPTPNENDANNQVDFIYAYATSAKTANKVPLNFKHALSQVVFKAKNTHADIEVQIDKIAVCFVKEKGTFTFPTAVDTEGSWNLDGSPVYDYVVSFDKTKIVNTVELTSKAEQSQDALLLLPQTVGANQPETCYLPNALLAEMPTRNGFYFLVKLSYKDTTNGVYLYGSESQTEYVAIPAAIKWEQGKRYVYTFVFGDGMNGGYVPGTPNPVLYPINFSVTVDDFEDVEKDVNLNAESQDLK